MSVLSASSGGMGRPLTVTTAIGLLVLIVVVSVPTVMVTMAGFDPGYVTIATTLAICKLVAAAGLWRCRRWAMFLGFGATLLDTVLGTLSVFDTTDRGAAALMAVGAVLGVLALILLVVPASRRAYA